MSVIIPSFLQVQYQGVAEPSALLRNPLLRVGEVKEILYPDNPLNINKRLTEYKVEVQHSEDGLGGGRNTYVCTVASMFGGVADFLEYTVRKADGRFRREDGLGTGAKVLILCINGHTAQALILAGLRDVEVDRSIRDRAEDGHHLLFEFNGVGVRINRDGEFRLQFRGRTDNMGNVQGGEDAQPTTLEILQNGSLEISTRDRAQFLRLDHEKKEVALHADESLDVTVNKALRLGAGSGALDFDGDCSLTLGDKLSVSCGEASVVASGYVRIHSQGLRIGDATEPFPRFGTYRQQQIRLHQQLLAGFTQLQAMVAATAAALNAAPGAQGAATAMAGMVPVLAQMSAALASFEAQAPIFISIKNKND